jgi:hypothetical protein
VSSTCRNDWCSRLAGRRGALCAQCRTDRNNALRRLKRGNNDPAGPLPATAFRRVLNDLELLRDDLDVLEEARLHAQEGGASGVPFEKVDDAVRRIRAHLTDVRQGTARWRALDAITLESN